MDIDSRYTLSTRETRRDRWGETVASSFLPLDFDIARTTRFYSQALWAPIDSARAAEVRMCEHRVSRRPIHEANADGAAVKILWLLNGKGRLVQGNDDNSLNSLDWTFYDASRPYSLQLSEDARFFSLLYTGDRADEWARMARQLGGRGRLTTGPARIALIALRTAIREKQALTLLAQRALLGSVLSLTESALRQEIPSRVNAADRDALRLLEAQNYILQHLDRPQLGPDDIARALHMSRRSLYNLFADADLRPRAFIQNLRLDRASTALINRHQSGDSITSIALDHGFTDAAHFSRSFRKRFGVSPSHYNCDSGR
ncbi:MAG: helix-turn-helix domain-containing protein [Azoarcus sp.]|nr:helix-turn-helix domain-containing protein [Azoarcus sp.]